MRDNRKKPGIAFWATVALVVVLLYFASLGPALRVYFMLGRPEWMVEPLRFGYAPVSWVFANGPEWGTDLYWTYLKWWRFIPGA